jgi:hypothetical protein
MKVRFYLNFDFLKISQEYFLALKNQKELNQKF